jgi:hypothetical protein
MVPINYYAVLIATIAGYALGALWYGPLFGKAWIGLMGWPAEKVEAMKSQSQVQSYILMLVGQLVMSFVLAHSLIFASEYLDIYGWQAGIMAGFWSWLGFIAPVQMGSVLWDGKSWKLFGLNTSYYLVSLLLMGVILALLP